MCNHYSFIIITFLYCVYQVYIPVTVYIMIDELIVLANDPVVVVIIVVGIVVVVAACSVWDSIVG